MYLSVLIPIFHFKVSEGRIYDHYLHIPLQFGANSSAKKCLLDGWMERRTERRMDGCDGLQRTSREHIIHDVTVIQDSQQMECSGYHNILMKTVLLPQHHSRFDHG